MRTRAKKKSIFLRIALLAAAIYAVVLLVQLQLQLRDKAKELDSLVASTGQQAQYNEQLKEDNANPDQFLDEQARENGFAKPGESVFEIVPG